MVYDYMSIAWIFTDVSTCSTTLPVTAPKRGKFVANRLKLFLKRLSFVLPLFWGIRIWQDRKERERGWKKNEEGTPIGRRNTEERKKL